MATAWDILTAIKKYDGSPSAHADTLSTLRKHGKSVSQYDAWCSEQAMAILYDAGAIDLIGYSADSGTIKSHAQKKGIWHSGTSGMMPFDIVLFGRSGKTNHTEMSLGKINLSGNYNGGTSRRSRGLRSIVGYARLKLSPMPDMDNLQIAVCATDTILDVYGGGKTREKYLSIWGAKNAQAIQDRINAVWGNDAQVNFLMAVSAIAGYLGKDDYRRKRLGKRADAVQARIDAIWAMRGKSLTEVARLVIANKFSTGAIRRLLLEWCGYNYDAVQAKVEELLKPTPSAKVRLYAPRFWENNQNKYYGDESIFLQYDKNGKIAHCTVFDTGMAGALGISKIKALGIKHIDAIVITHDHSDHHGLVTNMVDSFSVDRVYFPEQTGVRKYQSYYADRMDKKAAYIRSRGVPVTYLKKGDSFVIGAIKVDCIFMANADALPEKDDHHFINNMSMVYKVTVNNKFRILIGGDLSADGIRQMMAAGVDYSCDVFKCFWHSDRGAITTDFAQSLNGTLIAYTQYEHSESNAGRRSTHNLLRNSGILVARACDDGEIKIDMWTKTIRVIAGGTTKTFTV